MKRLLLVALLSLLIGCASPTAPEEEVAWSPAYDAAWSEVTACWGTDPPKPRVTVRTDCIGGHHFVDEWNRDVHGYFLAENDIQLCPDLAVLQHELSEYTCYKLTGAYCNNGRGGCFDVVR